MSRTGKAAIIISALIIFGFLAALGTAELIRGGLPAGDGYVSSFREKAVTLNNSLISGVFGFSGSDQVVCGKDGWLFYKETLADFTRNGETGTVSADGLAAVLRKLDRYCEENGAEFILVVVPDKNSLYGEKMPPYIRRGGSADADYNAVMRIMTECGIKGPDVLAALEAEKESSGRELYFKTDTHWNTYGASVCADYLLAELKGYDGYYRKQSPEEIKVPGGDLYRLLYPDAGGSDTDQVFADVPAFSFTGNPLSMMEPEIITENETAGGRLLVYRDSFANALIPLLSGHFGHVIYTRGNDPFDFGAVATERPDAVILEIAERNIKYLTESEFHGIPE